jgi:hypothetical protein
MGLTKGTLAATLQSLPESLHWALADSSLLQAQASQQPVQRGPRGNRLYTLLSWADRFRLSGWVLLLVGLVEALFNWRRQGSLRKGGVAVRRFFIGFGAGSEEALYLKYQAEAEGQVARLSQVDVSTFGPWRRAGLGQVLTVLWAAHRTALEAATRLPESLAPNRLQFLTFAGMRLGSYSFMRAWFEGIRETYPDLVEVCFLSADTPAFAAVDAGMPTRHLQHGFIRHSLLLPNFQRIDALTYDEAHHYRLRLPAARIELTTFPDIGCKDLSRGILIASVYERQDEMRRILPFLEWTRMQGCPVWIRRHPREDQSFWDGDLREGRFRIEDGDANFLMALQRLRPRIVVSWYSTALADALNFGIVPVNINDEETPSVVDIVYPLLDRALQWPRQQAHIARLMNDDELYRVTIRALRGTNSEICA